MEKNIKIIGVISSARRQGNTAALVRQALEGARQAGAETQEIFLADHKLGFCTGCLKCCTEGVCPLSDGFEGIRKALYSADGIIFGSPTYGGTYNASLKNLYERLGMYTLLTSSLGGKYVAGISTANGKVASKTAKAIVNVFRLSFFKRTFISGSFGVAMINHGKPTDLSQARKSARSLGRKVADDIKAGRAYPMQSLLPRLLVKLKIKPLMVRYLSLNKDGREKATYSNLKLRGLI